MKFFGSTLSCLFILLSMSHANAEATDESVAASGSSETVNATVVEVTDSAANNDITTGLAKDLSRLKPEKSSDNTSSQTSYVDMALGLLAVLGVIVALAWLAKRFNVSGMSLSQSMKLQSVLSLGTKEKVVVVNVEGRRFLLGVTTHQITILSELDAETASEKGDLSVDNQSFAQQIKNAIKQGKLSEHSKAS